MTVLQEIDNWKLDAKFEETDRYFFHGDNVSRIQSGDFSYVIGRKGCGKTAISESIYNISSHDSFSEKLTFKNFPFNELYKLSNDDYTRPNQYITLWKYLIYSSVCRMLVRNEAIDGEVSSVLEKIFGSNKSIPNLRRSIGKWVGKEWSIKILGLGGKLSFSENGEEQTWIEKADVLEDVISEYIDKSNYYILFDELDEDYSNIVEKGNQNDYLSLITSLFKAVQDIRSVFSNTKISVKPIIFLRDDIYDLIMDPDKNKWNDFRIDLDWNKDSIKKLLAFRISKAISGKGKLLSFQDAWSQVFYNQPVGYGTRQQKKTNIFEYITYSTHLRPRDYIRYLQVCAHEVVEKGGKKISPDVVKSVDKAFSNYLKSELVDEIHGILPDIQEIFSILSEIRKNIFSIDEFNALYNKRLKSGAVANKDVDFVLKILFHFSVVGNQPKQKKVKFFRYSNKEARLNFNEKLVVHRGLLKALQIM